MQHVIITINYMCIVPCKANSRQIPSLSSAGSEMGQRHSITLKYEKHFQKMYRDVGMAVPKTTETKCRDGSVQGRHVIQRLPTNPIPTSFLYLKSFCKLCYKITGLLGRAIFEPKKRCRDGVSCVVFV